MEIFLPMSVDMPPYCVKSDLILPAREKKRLKNAKILLTLRSCTPASRQLERGGAGWGVVGGTGADK